MDFHHILFIPCLEIWTFVFLFLVDFTSLENQTSQYSAAQVPKATESRREKVSPAEALAGVGEGPRGWPEGILKGRRECCLSFLQKSCVDVPVFGSARSTDQGWIG